MIRGSGKVGLIFCFMSAFHVIGADWPQWGNGPSRNMVSTETGIPDSFEAGKMDYETEVVDMSTTRNVKWIAKLGSQAYGNPTISQGRVLVGTNNEAPRDPRHQGDRGIVMCVNEADGQLLWQLVVPKLGAGKVSDWEYLGICSSPLIDGDRVYVVTNRCEVVCVDLNGFKDGNDGPFQDEVKYMFPGSDKGTEKIGKTDADIIWIYDMREELGVFPHNIASSSVLLVDGKLYVTTSNGQDWSHVNIPAPKAPCLAVLDAKTGTLIGEENSGISFRLFHCNWSSPAYGVSGDRAMVLFGGGDGFCYAFEPDPIKGDDGFNYLKEIWRFNCNPQEYLVKDDKPIRYPSPDGKSEIISTPVFYKDHVYVSIGQDPEHGQGAGMLSCIKTTGDGDISASGAKWTYKDLHRTISTPAIHEGLVYAADFTGRLHCLDADTGAVYWVHDTMSNIWSSPLVVDGKVYQGNEDGILTVYSTGKTLKVRHTIDMGAPIYSSPVAANGTLYIATQTHLYAIAKTPARQEKENDLQ